MDQDTDDDLLLSEMNRMLFGQIEAVSGAEDLSDEAMHQLVNDLVGDLSGVMRKELENSKRKMLRDERKDRQGFERRNNKRWKPAFDQLEAIIKLVTEISGYNDRELRPEAVESGDYVFESVAHLLPRAILVSQEVMCLLRGGYPDGALTRWRALHELNVTAHFIAKHGDDVARDYLASFYFNAFRAAKQLSAFADRANMEPFSDAELSEFEQVCEEVEEELGRRIGANYDWARRAFPNLSPKGKVTFDQIEANLELDHWRPRYRWASQHTHAGHRPADKMLGMAESSEYIFLVGASNSGFVDPLDMTAISLFSITACALTLKPNLDRLVYLKILQNWVDELGPLAREVESETLMAARSAQKKK